MSMTVKQRSGLIPAPAPNWKSKVSANYEFKTSTITAHDGTEQRAALRQTARTSWDYSALLTQAAVLRHMGDLASSQDAIFTAATPGRSVRCTARAGRVLDVSTLPFWAVAGATVILDAAETQEVATVESVAGNAVTLALDPSYEFAAGDTIRLASTGRMQAKATFTAETDNLFQGSIKFALDPGRNLQTLADISPAQFEDRDIWDTKPDWSSRPQITLESDRSLVDTGRGVVGSYNSVAYHTRMLRLGYLFTRTQAAEEFLAFFFRQQGKRGSFWMPTWTTDMVPMTETTRNVEVAGTEIAEAFEASSVYNTLYFGGQVNRVSSYEIINSGADTRLVMADQWSNTIPAGSSLSWCPRWRWATDKLAVEWTTDSVAEVATTFQTLPNEAP